MEGEELIGEWQHPPEGGALPVTEDEFIANLRANCKIDLPNVNSESEHDKIMVMVCGGPTAKLFLEEIRQKSKDDQYRIFCSNKTHDWLIENDIVPYCQFIIDPKKIKIEDVRHPNSDVLYIIGAQCNPTLFDALKGYNVKRVFNYCNVGNGIKDYQIVNALFDKKEFAPVDGGTMAGLRAMTLGDVLGYRTVEFYGFDSCFFDYDSQGNPIYYSYEKGRAENILECKTEDGKIYLSSPVFASQARQFIKWKNKIEWMKFIIHGDSLTAAINRIDEEKRKPMHDRLISDYMLKMNKELHEQKAEEGCFGNTGQEHGGAIAILAGQLVRKYGDITILDYGCGKCTLEKILPPITGQKIINYDPCIEGLDIRPEPADIVVCTDVLEHIEPDCIENVLDDLQRLTKKVLYLSICLVKAIKSYSDGQNCHLIVENESWWYPKLKKRFNINEFTKTKNNRGYISIIAAVQTKEIR